MKNKFLLLLILTGLFLGVPSFALTEKEAELNRQIEILQEKIRELKARILIKKELNAASYLTVNLSDNSVVLEKNSNFSYPIASITKLMNAVIVLENIELNQTVYLNKEMLSPLGYSPSLFSGLKVSAKNLLKASLIQSTNDAANSLSYFLKRDNFIDLMNRKAEEIGMNDTSFYDPHGLSPLNRSTASDILKLISYVYANHPEVLDITRDNNFWLPNKNGRLLKFKNVNNFYQTPGFIGGKTGYLPEARQTLVSLFDLKESPTAIILLYSEDRQADALKIINFIKKAP